MQVIDIPTGKIFLKTQQAFDSGKKVLYTGAGQEAERRMT